MLSLSIIAAAAIRTAYDFSARDGSMWISDGAPGASTTTRSPPAGCTRQIGPVPDGVQVAQVRGLLGVRRRGSAAAAAARRGPVLQLVPQHD